jgi:polysaccharide chain length determinant protein (PEP-CTERM system associated)
MEDRIAGMRERIRVEVIRDRGRKQKDTDAFAIAYQDKDPRVAMQVVNGLAGLFMDENLKMRETKAVGTSDFLEAELESSRKRLEALEQELNEYRKRHMGELPEQLDANLRVLDRLNTALNEKERSLQNARVNLMAIENEMAVRQNALSSAAVADAAPAAKVPEEQMSVAQLKEKLAGLRAAYTDQHPDVVRLKAKIEKLDAESRPAASTGAGRTVEVGISATAVRQTTVISGTIRALELEIANLNREIKEYQRRVEATPKRELEMLSLKRDYDNMKASYNSLLNRRLEAEISVNLEKKQKGEQFQIIEPATVPSRPVSPDLRKLFLLTIAAGLGLGGGLVFLLEMADTSVRKREDIEEKFGLAILATVPRIFDYRDVSRRRIRTAATVASVLLALVLTAGLASLSFMGVEKTFEMVRIF